MLLSGTGKSVSAQNTFAEKNILIGKWKYDIAYDTIAMAGDQIGDTTIFINKMKILKYGITVTDLKKTYSGTWDLLNSHEFIIYLDNKKSYKFYLTILDKKHFELQRDGDKIATLGYKRK